MTLYVRTFSSTLYVLHKHIVHGIKAILFLAIETLVYVCKCKHLHTYTRLYGILQYVYVLNEYIFTIIAFGSSMIERIQVVQVLPLISELCCNKH